MSHAPGGEQAADRVHEQGLPVHRDQGLGCRGTEPFTTAGGGDECDDAHSGDPFRHS
ncbi:hypothetical protein GCM10012275_14440 [Longimycelium tulufanense]|uniref:Uncharacterized protein n=1 Tax=Longimycelium tulufanense TaxID=907463 RepID=A0A8J3C6Y1_9PSEU|nr:hypothetical protein GCM10012275_14440 [Longimycelium tulufanense]